MTERQPVNAYPLVVSQHNCGLAGFKNARAFRDWVSTRKVPHTRVGKTVFVRAEVLLFVLASHETSAADVPDPGDDTPKTVDEVLARLGLRRTT